MTPIDGFDAHAPIPTFPREGKEKFKQIGHQPLQILLKQL